MKIITALLIAAGAATPVAAITASTTIADGGFEDKGASTPVTDYCYDSGPTPGGVACASSPWIGNGVIASGSGPWGGTLAAEGSYYAFVQSTGVLSQTFTPGTTGQFTVNWLDTNRTNNGGAQSYTVSIEQILIPSGPSISEVFAVTDLGTFTSATGAFVARSSSSFLLTGGETYILSFTGLSGDDRTAFIDAVTLNAVNAVPEPATWGLMLAGFGLVGFAARRRRRSAATA